MLTYAKAEKIKLKTSPDFNEAWLQDRIAEDPSIIGLGDLTLIQRERTQGKAGRLDLLLSDPDQDRRYEVELMLGATDASHVIRTIEYWDIERRRYPAYEHVAVLVAEDVTTRYLNVLALFSGSIPLIAIQLEAMKIDDKIILSFVKVLDQTDLRVDDEEEQASKQPADRAYWESKASPETVSMADDILKVINEASSRAYELNYNRQFIGLTDGGRSRNVIVHRPRKKHMRLTVRVRDGDRWLDRLEEAGVEAKIRKGNHLILTFPRSSLEANRELIDEIIKTAVREYED